MRNTRRCGGRAYGGKDKESGGDEEYVVTTGLLRILYDLDIYVGRGVGRGVVLVTSASDRVRGALRARSLLRGGMMSGHGNNNDNNNNNAPSTS